MKHWDRVIRFLSFVLVFFVSGVVFAGRVVTITLCRDIVQPDLVPVDIQENFGADAPAIHAVVLLEDMNAGTKLKGEWVSVDAITTPNYVIDATEMAVDQSTTRAHFALSRPNRGWPVGNYRLNVYLDGKLAAVKTFKIIGAPGSQGPASVPSAAARPSVVAPPRTERGPEDAREEQASTGFSGIFSLPSDRTTLTLKLQQSPDGTLKGTLSSSTGVQFQLEGMVQEGTAMGICASNEGKVFFEASLQGNQLHLALLEPDANNMPDYRRARQLVLNRMPGAAPRSTVPSTKPGSHLASSSSSKPASGEVASEPSWGFRFHVPAGWKIKKEASGAILGHDTIAGAILVFPHTAASMQEVQQQMQQGLSEENSDLRPAGNIGRIGENGVGGIYQGRYQGQPVKARGIGIFSPGGGGAYILGISTPEKFSEELAQAADSVAGSLEPAHMEVSEVMQHFVGTWFSYTKNTSNEVTLYGDGTFSMNYEASYSLTPDSSGATGWGLARQNRNRGRWTVRGSRTSGVITLKYPDGSTEEVQYRVHQERGETYWSEYYFDGNLYGKKRD